MSVLMNILVIGFSFKYRLTAESGLVAIYDHQGGVGRDVGGGANRAFA
jgi:hypothetical protein